jgi:hypothetical protein
MGNQKVKYKQYEGILYIYNLPLLGKIVVYDNVV